MDQTALERLLKELRGLDEPEEIVNGTAYGQEAHASTLLDNQAVPSKTSDDLDCVAGQGNSELERLLGSLRPIAPSSYSGFEVSSQSNYNGFPNFSGPPHATEVDQASLLETTAPDIRKFTFAQALPLKSEQELFELSILDERNKAKSDLEKQLKRAQDAAVESGVTYEVVRITKLLNIATSKFDKQALAKWDIVASQQQAKLEQLSVPCFYVLKGPEPLAQERQRRVMEMLTTLLNDS
ncbi:MAG: hypothetical protein CYPHOPRED_003675 [Cyphobasidiales sp. Tagirdzhanova-0007]|nr:MAG: hypothetical protein CYPHOPRED_003675 [Cyphobasidiales sp. Tagirdzhanova-0007]